MSVNPGSRATSRRYPDGCGLGTCAHASVTGSVSVGLSTGEISAGGGPIGLLKKQENWMTFDGRLRTPSVGLSALTANTRANQLPTMVWIYASLLVGMLSFQRSSRGTGPTGSSDHSTPRRGRSPRRERRSNESGSVPMGGTSSSPASALHRRAGRAARHRSSNDEFAAATTDFAPRCRPPARARVRVVRPLTMSSVVADWSSPPDEREKLDERLTCQL
jgi:hypothetical protein